MTKTQKIWLWISVAMFVVPEVFFSFLTLSVISFFGKDFLPLITKFIDQQFFTDHPIYLIYALAVEVVGVLILAIISFQRNKKPVAIFLSIIFLWLTFVLYMGYMISFRMSFP